MNRDDAYARNFGSADRARNGQRPADQGDDFEQEVATIERRDGAVKIRAKTFKGHPFIDLRFFTRGQDGALYPTQKGLSVRIQEAGDVCEAIQEAVTVLAERESARR